MFLAFTTAWLLVAADAAPADSKGNAVLVKLQDEKLWTEGARTKELLQNLSAAKSMRTSLLAPVLARHIAYTPFDPPPISLTTTEILHPAYGILVTTGLPAVQAILDQLKVTDYKEQIKEDGPRKHCLLVFSLIDIYNQGGRGSEMARRRIQLELDVTPEKGRDSLLEALKHSQLKE